MVAGNHNRLNTCPDCVGNRLLALLARRVNHRDKAEEGVAVFGFLGELLFGLLIREGEDAKTF